MAITASDTGCSSIAQQHKTIFGPLVFSAADESNTCGRGMATQLCHFEVNWSYWSLYLGKRTDSLPLQALRQSKGHSNHQIVAKDRSKEVSFEFSSPSTIGSMNCDGSFSSKRGGVFISFTKVDLPSRYHICRCCQELWLAKNITISSNDSSGVRWRIE